MSAIGGIKNVLASLLPSYETSKLEGSIERNTKVLTNKVLPELLQLQELLKTKEGGKYSSDDVTQLSNSVVEYCQRRGLELPGLKHPTILEYTIATVQNIAVITPFVVKELRGVVGKSLLTDGLTFNRKALLQIIDMVDFFTGYTALLINYITAEEVASVAGTNIDVDNVGPIDMQYMKLHTVPFAISMRVLGTPINKLKADYAEIPDVVFDENNYDEMVAAWGTEKVDPMGMNGVPFPLSTILRARLFLADHAMDKYEETVKSAELAQMRIAYYRKRQTEQGKEGDAGLENMIANLEKDLTKLKRKRESMEKKLKISDLAENNRGA